MKYNRIQRHAYINKMGDFVLVCIFIFLILVGGTGYIFNISKLSECSLNKQGGECIVRGAGLIAFPLGCIIGYIDFDR